MITLNNVNIKFDKVLIENSSISLLDGNITSIIGESGCGKSSLLYLIGLISANIHYEYIYDGQSLNLGHDKQMSMIRKKKMGYLFQENNLIDNLTIRDHFIITTRLAGIKMTDEHIKDHLKHVQLDIDDRSYPRKLSSGERQRAALACVLAKDPDLIIADEPTSALDPTNSDLILRILKDAAYKKNKKVVIATHNEKIYQQTDRIYEIKNQKIYQLISGQNP